MDFSLTEEQQRRRADIIRFAQTELNSGMLERDAGAVFSRELWTRCKDVDLLGLFVGKDFGGAGLDAVSTILAMEAFGYGCHDAGLTFAVGAHLFSCVLPIWKHGTEEQKARYLPGLCNGQLIGGNATTEPEAGSDVFSMSTAAQADGASFRISGRKIFVSNGPVADILVLSAVTDEKKRSFGGISTFIIETATNGVSRSAAHPKMGLRTSPLGDVVFENCQVSSENRLGQIGAGATIFSEFMAWERIGISAAHVGAMERILETTVARARKRVQFGQPIGKFQAIAHPIADIKLRLEAARLLVYRAAWLLERNKNVLLDAALAKLCVSESFVRAAETSIRVFGGAGYLTETGVERALRDAMASPIYSGTSDIQRNIIARWVGL
jgi:alkylation response protein AidB-like acyl-CoA dehydrogenase